MAHHRQIPHHQTPLHPQSGRHVTDQSHHRQIPATGTRRNPYQTAMRPDNRTASGYPTSTAASAIKLSSHQSVTPRADTQPPEPTTAGTGRNRYRTAMQPNSHTTGRHRQSTPTTPTSSAHHATRQSHGGQIPSHQTRQPPIPDSHATVQSHHGQIPHCPAQQNKPGTKPGLVMSAYEPTEASPSGMMRG